MSGDELPLHLVGEPEDAESAVTYWRGRWADTASALTDALGVITDLCDHATPIAIDSDGFAAVGYTVTIGAVHRALGWRQGTRHVAPLAAERDRLAARVAELESALREVCDAIDGYLRGELLHPPAPKTRAGWRRVLDGTEGDSR